MSKYHIPGTLVLAYKYETALLGTVSKVVYSEQYDLVRYKIDWVDGDRRNMLYTHERVQEFIDTYQELNNVYQLDVEKFIQDCKNGTEPRFYVKNISDDLVDVVQSLMDESCFTK